MQFLKETIEVPSQIKKISSEPSGKGHTSPGKNVAGKVFLSKYEILISYQASVATYGMVLVITSVTLN